MTLRELDAFVGEWRMVISTGGRPAMQARTTFEWIEGRRVPAPVRRRRAARLRGVRGLGEALAMPTTSVIGLDDTGGEYTMLYSDAREVYRVYRMTFAGGTWTVWRDAPGFNQRLIATFDAAATPSPAAGSGRTTARPGSPTSTSGTPGSAAADDPVPAGAGPRSTPRRRFR
jgi:hypothetical protein